MKTCASCKWSKGDDRFMECYAPQNMERRSSITPIEVTGEELTAENQRRRYSYCATHRDSGWIDALMTKCCGKRGRWYVRRNPDAQHRQEQK